MNNSEKPNQSVFEVVEGLTEVDAEAVEEFRRAMTEEVIPEIEEVIQERRTLAASTRMRQLKS
jgi:hypothetical protein